jgi:vacuolar-type H+-ATPase subunit C/Vma6
VSFSLTLESPYVIIPAVIIMTKKELIKYLGDKVEELSEDDLNELASYADYLDWRKEIENLKEQYAESLKDIEKGDVYTLDEIEKGVDVG